VTLTSNEMKMKIVPLDPQKDLFSVFVLVDSSDNFAITSGSPATSKRRRVSIYLPPLSKQMQSQHTKLTEEKWSSTR
jgi:hypothetical protein